MNESSKQSLLISKGWVQAVALVMLFGFFTLGLLAYRTYTDEPPIPDKVVDNNGNVLFTGQDVTAGQEIFLKNGLMEYGSIFGHGAYLGRISQRIICIARRKLRPRSTAVPARTRPGNKRSPISKRTVTTVPLAY
jgi:hypothetical protein